MKKVKLKIISIITLAFLNVLIVLGCNVAQGPNRNQTNPSNDLGMERNPGDNVGMNNQNTPGQTVLDGVQGGTDLSKFGEPNNTDGNGVNVPNTTMPGSINDNINITETNKKAQDLANQLSNIEGVEKATVVISENTALIGVNCTEEFLQSGDITSLKQDITESIKEEHPEITNVVVSETPDLYQRISNLSKDVGDGKPVKKLGNEFKQIINKITPTM